MEAGNRLNMNPVQLRAYTAGGESWVIQRRYVREEARKLALDLGRTVEVTTADGVLVMVVEPSSMPLVTEVEYPA